MGASLMMPPLEIEPLFPSNPAVGERFTSPDGSRTWEWNGDRWVLIESGAVAPPAVAAQTPWLTDINADEFRLGAVGQIIVGNVGATPFSPAYPSVIIDSHGLTWYGFASITGTNTTGLTISSQYVNISTSEFTVNGSSVLTPWTTDINANTYRLYNSGDITIGIPTPFPSASSTGIHITDRAINFWGYVTFGPPGYLINVDPDYLTIGSYFLIGVPGPGNLPRQRKMLWERRRGYLGIDIEPEYKLDVDGDVNISAGHSFLIDGVPASAGAGGLNRQLQFNDNGALAGAAGTYTSLEWSESDGWLQLVAGSGAMTFASAGGGFILATTIPEPHSLQMYVESFVVACYDEFGEHHGIFLLGGDEAGFQVPTDIPGRDSIFRVHGDGFQMYNLDASGAEAPKFNFDQATGDLNITGELQTPFVNSMLIRSNYTHPTIPYLNVYNSAELNSGLLEGTLQVLGAELLFRGERLAAGSVGPGLKRWSLRKDQTNNLSLIRYDDSEARSALVTFYRETHPSIGGILIIGGDINAYGYKFITTGVNQNAFRVQEYYGFNYFQFNNENSNLNFDGNYAPENTTFRIMEMNFRERLITSHAPMNIEGDVRIDGDVYITGRLFINGVEVVP